MIASVSPWLWLSLLGTLCLSLATSLHLWFQGWSGNRVQSGNAVQVLLGDSRRLFANHFFVKADVSFHGGYYPSLFDQVEQPKTLHVAVNENRAKDPHEHHDAHVNHEDMPDFLHSPQNWIDRFGRHFYPAEHRHLSGGQEEKELLPWLLFFRGIGSTPSRDLHGGCLLVTHPAGQGE